MSKLFNLRLPDQLLNAIENARVRFGESSTSEAARRLIERGLDPVWDEDNDDQAAITRKVLLGLIGKFHQGTALLRDEWRFLAHHAHEAYLYAEPGRSFVQGELVRDVVLAFGACLSVRKQAKGHQKQDSDGYFRSKLSIDENEELIAGVQRVGHKIDRYCSPIHAEFVSRPLYVFLRDEGRRLPEDLLNQALRPYLGSLLLLAIRSHSTKHSEPLHLPSEEFDSQFKPESNSQSIEIGGMSICAYDHGRTVSVVLDLNKLCPALITLNGPIEILDFFETINQSITARENIKLSAGNFEIQCRTTNDPTSHLSIGQVKFLIPNEKLIHISELINAVKKTAQLAVPLERLKFSYGAI